MINKIVEKALKKRNADFIFTYSENGEKIKRFPKCGCNFCKSEGDDPREVGSLVHLEYGESNFCPDEGQRRIRINRDSDYLSENHIQKILKGLKIF